jgi:DNA repair protein RadA/Sms
MAKAKESFVCEDCGENHARWLGQCSKCKAWNTLKSFKEAKVVSQKTATKKSGYSIQDANIEKLSELKNLTLNRFDTGSSELNRVLGGGAVEASVILISGSPGAGKSTLIIDVLSTLSQIAPALLVSGEESKNQIKDRGDRLGLPLENIDIMTSGDVEMICDVVLHRGHKFLVIDSIQTMFLTSIDSSPGGVSQVKGCAGYLNRMAKEHGVTLFLIVHETKDGSVSGPQTLSHIGDATLQLSTESDSKYRTLRAKKNRFGSAEEIGTFAMMANGLKDVKNPSSIFLEHGEPASGNIAYASAEGGRTLLVNMQSLVDESVGEKPERSVVGVDYKRLPMLLAVMARRMNVRIGFKDIFVNVVGGVKLVETGTDVPIMLAMLSSHNDKVLSNTTIAFGEIGLGGEIRAVSNGHERVKEAIRNGFKTIVLPQRNYSPKLESAGVCIIPVSKVSELQAVFDKA